VDDGTMTLDQRRFGRMVSRHALLILITIVVGVAVAAGLTLTKATSYTATTQLRVANPLTLNDVLGNVNTSNGGTVVTVADQIAVLQSDSVKDQVKSRVGPGASFGVSFFTPGTGQVVTVKATAKSRDGASKVAAAYTQTYLDNLAVRNTPLFTSASTQLTGDIKAIDSQVTVLTKTLARASATTLNRVNARVGPQITQLLNSRNDLSKQLNSVELARSVTPSGNGFVVSAPTTVKDGSSTTTIIIGALVGLLLGLLLAGIREARFGRIVDEKDAERLGLPVVATVATPLPRRVRTAATALAGDRDTPAYRASSVLLAPPHASEIPRHWLVTSVDRDGVAGAVLAGKLARLVAQTGRRVALVDTAAAGQPRAAAGPHAGLAEVLRGEVAISQSLALDGDSKVTVMGPGVGLQALSEPLAGAAFAGVLDSLGDHFDVIILSGAPLEQSADAYVLLPLVNLVVVALHRGVTRRRSLEDAIPRLAAVGSGARLAAILVGGRKSSLSRRSPSGGEPVTAPTRAPQPVQVQKGAAAASRVPLHGSST
jgi:Mrp family chromosome partitioning ATPase/capsular polysaccharide biosynthesis protein